MQKKRCVLHRETTWPVASLPHPDEWPHVPGIKVGDVVFSRFGRRMRVQQTNTFVITGTDDTDTATGPYCSLVALDDKNAGGIWPRHWYTLPGETQQLTFGR